MSIKTAKVQALGLEIATLLSSIGVTEFTMNVKEQTVDVVFNDQEVSVGQIEDVTEDIKLITEQL